MSVTAKELARQLGLSPAAVSMALGGKHGVSEATRERVLAAARAQGYDFSRTRLVGLRGKIALVIYKKHGAVVSDTPFFAQLIEGVSASCQKNRYNLDIRYFYESENIAEAIQELRASSMDGIILLGTEMQPADFVPFEQLPEPMIVLDTYFEGIAWDCVTINNVQGAYLATNYLISKRKAQPGYLHSSYSIANFEERADGFYKAVRQNGMSASRSIVHRLAPSMEGAYSDMKALLEAGEATASCYFADNDLIAAGAMKALKEAGLLVPQDAALIGFDNTSLCELIEPALTTVHVPKQDMGRLAVERLLDAMKDPNLSIVKIELATYLVRRKSL